jgi:diphthamide biosynthesis protein 3
MSIYEEVEIEDLDYDPVHRVYTYPCPCGDKFRITLEDLWDGEDIAPCPSCTLRIMIIYEEEDLPPLPSEECSDDEDSDEEESLKFTKNGNQENQIEEHLVSSVQKNLKVQ